jgi:hypothetical protein
MFIPQSHFTRKYREPIMSNYIYTAADVLTERRLPGKSRELAMNPAGSGHSSAPSGIFSLRRARYLYRSRFDETGHGVRRADIAEAAIAEVIGELEQSAGTSKHREPIPGRKSDTGAD